MSEREVLWGADHHEMGVVGVASVGAHTGIALSYGAKPKIAPTGAPNEDAVAVVVGSRATLLVVADGHTGYESVPAAVNAILDRLGPDPPAADLSDDEIVDLFLGANEAVCEVTGCPTGPAAESRTTLIICLLCGSRLQWASFGDSEVFVAGEADARSLGSPKEKFIGYPMDRAAVSELLDRGVVDLDAGEWVVAVTDGFTHFADRPGARIADLISRAAREGVAPAHIAEALVHLAGAGGAGDNVGVAVARPPSG